MDKPQRSKLGYITHSEENRLNFRVNFLLITTGFLSWNIGLRNSGLWPSLRFAMLLELHALLTQQISILEWTILDTMNRVPQSTHLVLLLQTFTLLDFFYVK